MEMHNGSQRRNGFNLQLQSFVRFIYFGKYMLFSLENTAGFIKEYHVTKKFPITFFNLKTAFTKIFC